MRQGVAVGQLYRLMEGDGVERELRVTSVAGDAITCVVEKWRFKPRLRGMRVILPDDARYHLVDEAAERPRRRVRRKTAL